MEIKQVLIVEDEVDFSDVLAEYLLLMEVRVSFVVVRDGVEALKLMESNEFDCIVTDVKMPNCDGVEFAEQLKKQGVDTPVIFMSGDGNEKLEKSLRELGAFDFLLKPFDKEDFSYVVEDALSKNIG